MRNDKVLEAGKHVDEGQLFLHQLSMILYRKPRGRQMWGTESQKCRGIGDHTPLQVGVEVG